MFKIINVLQHDLYLRIIKKIDVSDEETIYLLISEMSNAPYASLQLLSMYEFLMKIKLFDMWNLLKKCIMVEIVLHFLRCNDDSSSAVEVSYKMLQPKQICCACKSCQFSNDDALWKWQQTSGSAATDNRIVQLLQSNAVVICCCVCVLFPLLLVSYECTMHRDSYWYTFKSFRLYVIDHFFVSIHTLESI